MTLQTWKDKLFLDKHSFRADVPPQAEFPSPIHLATKSPSSYLPMQTDIKLLNYLTNEATLCVSRHVDCD